VVLDDDYADRLRDLAEYITPGPWHAYRSDYDGQLVVYDDDNEPLAAIYAGIDFAKWVCETAPAVLFGGTR